MATEQRITQQVEVDKDGYLSTGNYLVDRRARREIDFLVEVRFAVELRDWAAADTGPLHTRLGIRAEVAQELALLCSGLDTWAFVPGDEIFPATERSDSFRVDDDD